MKRESVNYVLVGAAVLVALVLLLGTLYAITGRSGPTDRYRVYYRNVAGVGYGTAVYYQGYRVGQVEAIRPEQDGGKTRFAVELSVTRGWQIPEDSTATLMASGLLSDVFVGISEGRSSTMLKPGGEIAGREGADVFAALASLAGEVTDLTQNRLNPLVEKIGKSLDAISGKLETGGPALVDDAVRLLAQLNDGAAALNQILGRDNREHFTRLLEHGADTAAEARRLAGELSGTRQRLDTLLASLDAAVTENRPELDQAMADLRLTLEALARRVDSITYHLESASRQFNEFAREVRREPNRLLFSPPADRLQDQPR